MKFFFPHVGALVFISFLFFSCKINQTRFEKIDTLNSGDKQISYDLKTRMDLAIHEEVQKTKDPELAYVPRERLVAAIEYTKQLQAGQEKLHKAAILMMLLISVYLLQV